MDKESKLQKNLQSRFNIGAKEEYKEGEEGKKKKGFGISFFFYLINSDFFLI